jgi:membrane associated rhomboid family serine protease
VIDDPPFDTGGVNVTVACPFPAVTEPIVGASGTVAGVIGALIVEEELVPTILVAVTVNVYEEPFERPVTVIGDDPPVAVCPPLEVTV